MLKTALSNLWAHKVRLLMSSLAIALGVGFVSGTFVMTDTLKASLTDGFSSTSKHVDAVVTPGKGHDTVTPGTLKKIRGMPDVDAAGGTVDGMVALAKPDGTRISSGNMPSQLTGIPKDPRLSRTTFTAGERPAGPRQMVIDAPTAKQNGLRIGQRIRVVGKDGTHGKLFKLVGLTKAGDNTVGVSVGMSSPVAAHLAKADGYDRVDVVGADSVSAPQLKQRMATALGSGYDLQTGKDKIHQEVQRNTSSADAVAQGLLLFAVVALLVAGLVIFNTFQILIAQRMREMALLRCVGATRRQIFTSVVTESALVGVVASAIGVVLGAGIGVGMLKLFGAVGFIGTSGSPRISVGPSVLALLAGIVVTMLSAVIPAFRATRIAPIAALRTQQARVGHRVGWPRTTLIAVCCVLGLGLAGAGITIGDVTGMFVVAAGGCVFFLGVLVAGPLYVPVLAKLIGFVPARSGVPGKLALANTVRNPGRTAALTIGLTLVTLFSVLGASMKASADERISEHFPVDYTLNSATFSSFSPKVAERLRAQPEVASVATIASGPGTVGGQQMSVAGMNGADMRAVSHDLAVHGALTDLRPGTVAVSKKYAAAHHLSVSQRLTVAGKYGGPHSLRIAVVYDEGLITDPVALPMSTFRHGFGTARPNQGLLQLKPGVSAAQGRQAVDQVLTAYPGVLAPSFAQAKEQLSTNVDTMIGVLYGLLALAIIIALFGIANTLSLSVFERTRESALVRALGLTKRQLRRMLSIEAGVMSVIGALLGVLLGVGFGWAVVTAMQESGLSVFAVSYWQIGLFIVLAAACGMLAAVLPARTAAKTSIVAALTDE